MNNYRLQIAIDQATGAWFPFSAWIDGYAKGMRISDADIAKKFYLGLRHLMNPLDLRKTVSGKPVDNQSPITAYRTGKKTPTAGVVYRLGRSLQELGAPVSGLDALIAAHHFEAFLGTVGAAVSECIRRSPGIGDLLLPNTSSISAILEAFAPAISREITYLTLKAGIRGLDKDHFTALHTPLPTWVPLTPEQTEIIDHGFIAWSYEEAETYQKLPPRFAAAIALVKHPTAEVVELARELLTNPLEGLSPLPILGVPHWAQKARADGNPPEQQGPVPEPDYTAINSFFAEFDKTFTKPGKPPGSKQSNACPNVDLVLRESEYHEPATAVEIDVLVTEIGFRGEQRDRAVIDLLKNLAEKYQLTLVTYAAAEQDDADKKRFREWGFQVCRAVSGCGRRLEWPRCVHPEEPGYRDRRGQ